MTDLLEKHLKRFKQRNEFMSADEQEIESLLEELQQWRTKEVRVVCTDCRAPMQHMGVFLSGNVKIFDCIDCNKEIGIQELTGAKK